MTSRSISLTWDPPTAANQNGIVHTYIINMTVLESGENVQLMSNSTDRDFVMLHPYYTYAFIISAVTIGPGPPSAVHNVITAEEGNLHLCLTTSSNNIHYANTTKAFLLALQNISETNSPEFNKWQLICYLV